MALSRALQAILTVLVCAAACAVAHGAPEPPVGFIWHYPFVDVGTDQLPQAGVSAMIARVAWRASEPAPGQFDFSTVDRQIVQAERGGYKLVLLLECNPFCAPAWVVGQVEAAGEGVRDAEGRATGQGPHGGIPRADSPVFLRLQGRFLREVVAHVKSADRQRVITHYQPGVEWWFPYNFRYASADVERFRTWLRSRHTTIAGVNAAWGASYRAFDDVTPPRIDVPSLFERGRAGWATVRFVGEPPPYRNVNAAVDDWSRFWVETAAGVIEDMARRVKQLDPSRRTATFLTHSFSSAAEWDYAQWAAIAIDEVGRRARSVDDLGMQLCVAGGDPLRVTAGLDIGRKYGKPLYVLDLLDFTLGVNVPHFRMLQATHAAIQHGASGLFYCCWNGAKDFNFYPDWPTQDLRAMLAEARQAIRQVEGTLVHAEAALLLPLLPASPSDATGYKNDPGSFIGWYWLLDALHQPVDVVTFRDIEQGPTRLERYRWVMMPDCAYVPRAVAARLARYQHQGGCVVAAGRFGRFDETGRPIDPTRSKVGFQPTRWPDDGRAYAGTLRREAKAGDTPPLIQRPPVTPERAAIRRRAAARLKGLLQVSHIVPEVEVLSEASDVSLVVRRGKGRRTVYLVNRAGQPVEGLRMRVRAGAGEAVSVLADLKPGVCRARRSGGFVVVTLPRFVTSCLLQLMAIDG